MGDPTGRLVEIAAAISDAPVQPATSREEAWGILRELVVQVPDFPTLEARFELFGFLVSEVRTVQELAATPWAEEREVFVEVEPGARVAGAPFHAERMAVGVRGPAPRFGAHTREVLAERCGLSDEELTRLEADGVIHSSSDVDTARPDWK